MGALLQLKFRIFINSIKNPSRPRRSLLFTCVAAVFMTGLYFWLRRILLYIVSVPIIGEVALVRFTALIIFIAGGLSALSSLIAAVSNIFTDPEMRMFLPAPVPEGSLFAMKMFETAIYADWMILVVACPFALAWMSIYTLGFLQILWLAAALIVFLLLMSFIGTFFASVFALTFPSGKIRDTSLVIFTVIFAGIFFYLKALEPEFLFQADMYANFFQYLVRLQTPGTLLAPFQWVGRLFIAVSTGEYAEAGIISSLLVFVSLVAGLVCYMFGSRFLLRICGKINAGGGSGLDFVSSVPASHPSAMKWREKKLFLRNSQQLVQFVILLALLAMYLFSVWKAPLSDIPALKELLTFLNIGALGLILSASALRFVFTGVSLDGRYLWYLFSSPVSASEILRRKSSFYMPAMIYSSLVLGLLSAFAFRTGFIPAVLTAAVSAVTAFVVTNLAIYFAVSYPVYSTESLPRIEASFGGLVFMITAMFYIAFALALLAYPVYWYIISGVMKFSYPLVWSLILIFGYFGLSALFGLYPIFAARRIFGGRLHRNMLAERQ